MDQRGDYSPATPPAVSQASGIGKAIVPERCSRRPVLVVSHGSILVVPFWSWFCEASHSFSCGGGRFAHWVGV